MLIGTGNSIETFNNRFGRIKFAGFLLDDPDKSKSYETSQKVGINVILK
jgi:hypothetical protein